MKFLLRIILILFFMITGKEKLVYAQVKKDNIYPENKVRYDSTYGITMYEKLNFALGGDSVRYDKKGYSANGWYEDYYENGKLLHKGYYAEGTLKTYQNFYANGQMERMFKSDYLKATMINYYKNGQVRSEIVYSNGNVIKETDYYENGKIEFEEEFDKNGRFIKSNFYEEDGKPTSTLVLMNPKKYIYEKKEYHENGKLKEEGTVVYFSKAGDYQKDGKWLVYDETGKLIAEQLFVKGNLASEKKQ